jgi:hypothetical protein
VCALLRLTNSGPRLIAASARGCLAGAPQPTLSAVEGEEEAALWAKVWEMQDAMAARRHSGGGKRHKSR